MKIRTATIVTLAVAAALGVFASTGIAATPHKTVAFTGSYSGTAAVNQTDTIANMLASGTGTGTLHRRRQDRRHRQGRHLGCSRASRSPAPER